MTGVAKERFLIRERFESVLSNLPAWQSVDSQKRETIIRRVERSCFEETIRTCILDGIDRLFTEKKFVDRYSVNCSRVLSNMDSAGTVGSNYLLNRLIIGDIDPYNVAKLTARELCPEANQAEREDIERRMAIKLVNKVSRAYVCRKCHGNETVYVEYQARSADEAPTRSIKCVGCEFVWRN